MIISRKNKKINLTLAKYQDICIMIRTGDMAELVECARLEIAYTGNCIEGSNPPISATILGYTVSYTKSPQFCGIFHALTLV